MELKDIIRRRKSVRSYTAEPVSGEMLRQIESYVAGAKPLYPQIRVQGKIVGRNAVRTIMPWAPPQMIAIYSEKKEGYLENAGFIFQQLDLYLQSMGLGACWLGLGKMKGAPESVDGLDFVILLAFGHPKGEAQRTEAQFKRKSLAEIADRPDPRLEPARLAPSSVNSQPWYFIHEDDTYHACCARKGLLKMMSDMNRIDMGIALAHIYIENRESFRFFRKENPNASPNHAYIGSFTIS